MKIKFGKIREIIGEWWSLPVLVGLALAVIVANYHPNQYISGWDNLHPEFNIEANLARSISAVWQEYQGVGLLGGMGHAADLVRQVLILVMGLALPKWFLRQGMILATLLVGPVGVYGLVRRGLRKRPIWIAQIGALASGAFYLLNFGTVQNFYVPFEPHYWFYGMLPWLLLALARYLDSGKTKDLWLVAGVGIVATPMAYIQTLFVVYLMVAVGMMVGWMMERKAKLVKGFVRIGKFLGVTGVVNAFWLLPVAYFTLTSSWVTVGANVNQMATPEVKLRNEAFGTVENIVKMRGYWYELHDVDQDLEFNYLFVSWREHFGQDQIEWLGYGLAAVALLGIAGAFVLKLEWRWSVVLVTGTVAAMLLNDETWLGEVVNRWKGAVPLVEQIFRSPFTKWVVPLALVYAVLFGWGVTLMTVVVDKWLKPVAKGLALLGVGLAGLGLVVYMKPVFEGRLFYDEVVTELPDEYFGLFDFFKAQDKQGRIAFFPAENIWGWNFYDWGYRGSGFLWYGIEQPILDRAFDVWSPYNEAFYSELSRSVYDQSEGGLETVLSKYGVEWVIVDEHVVLVNQEKDKLYLPEMKALLEKVGGEVAWEQGQVSVYRMKESGGQKAFVGAPGKYTLADTEGMYLARDVLYQGEGNYVGGDLAGEPVKYPFYSVLEEEVKGIDFREDILGWKTAATERRVKFEEGETLNLEAFGEGDKLGVAVLLEFVEGKLDFRFLPTANVLVDGVEQASYELPRLRVQIPPHVKEIRVKFGDKVVGVSEGDIQVLKGVQLEVGSDVEVAVFDATERDNLDLYSQFSEGRFEKCWNRPGADGVVSGSFDEGLWKLTTRDASGCLSLKLGNFGASGALVNVTLPYKSENGSRPNFCVIREEGAYKCEHREVFYSTHSSEEWTGVERQMYLSGGGVYWMDVMARPSDAQGVEWSIGYGVPVVESFPLIDDHRVSGKDMWADFLVDRQVDVEPGERVVRLEMNALAREVALKSETRSELKNCSVFGLGEVEREYVGKAVIYRSKDRGVSCDFIQLDDVSVSGEHLLRLTGINYSGRGLKMFINQMSNGWNVVERLVGEGKFDTLVYLTPWESGEDLGYRLGLESNSLGGEEAVDKLEAVEVYSLPVSWVSKIRVGRSEFEEIYSDWEVAEVDKEGSGLYEVKIKGSGNDGLVTLGQGYDQGWKGYKVQSSKCKIQSLCRFLPFLFGEELAHVKVNGWMNGWEIKESRVKSQELGEEGGFGALVDQAQAADGFGDIVGEEKTIVLVYWPQYLQWAGFGVLAVLAGVTWLVVIRQKGRFVDRLGRDAKISKID